MSQIWEYTKIAIKNIKSNKGRSVLTMLGIIIGISSVIMVMSVGNGVKKQMGEELNNIGGGQIIRKAVPHALPLMILNSSGKRWQG